MFILCEMTATVGMPFWASAICSKNGRQECRPYATLFEREPRFTAGFSQDLELKTQDALFPRSMARPIPRLIAVSYTHLTLPTNREV